jgi:hypothetical protein
MSPESKDLVEQIQGLSEEQQEAVRKFINYLKRAKSGPFLSAVEDFIEEHPELLRRLAK